VADDDDFEPRLGKMRSGGGKRARRYLSRVIAAANLAAGGTRRGKSGRSFTGTRIGRGAGTGRLLASRPPGSRRVIVKTSIVKLAGKGAAGAMAHLRYLQRDGTTREGEPGVLCDRDGEAADPRDFHARCEGDRHQFRFIVSPEDGDQFDDLGSLTRRLMERVEEDLGTKLDWVAVDHFNTGHPHTHIVVRGVDDRGNDLVIARDYLTRGIRERAAELVELDLGPPTQRDIDERLRREVGAERLTSIDRTLLREERGGQVSLAHPDMVEQTARAGRLAKLARMGLAEPLGAGRYRLADGLEDTLRRMGERGDIVRTMQREFAVRGLDRALADQVVFAGGRDDAAPLVGRVLARGLMDEGADRHFLIVDGLDGRTHFVGIGQGVETGFIAEGAVVEIVPRSAGARAVDRTIADVAALHGGSYDVDRHLAADGTATEDYAVAHVRRLEAARRGGVGVERAAGDRWAIPPDYLEQVEQWESRRLAARPVDVEILSPVAIDRLVEAQAPTWLDRDMASGNPAAVRDGGFGRDVAAAREARRLWLVEQELAEGGSEDFRYRRGALATLQRRELQQAARILAAELGKPFAASENGDRVEGVFRRREDLLGGRFAVVERAHDFTLVPWRPVLDRRVGQSVSGIVRETGVNWTIGRGRSGPSVT